MLQNGKITFLGIPLWSRKVKRSRNRHWKIYYNILGGIFCLRINDRNHWKLSICGIQFYSHKAIKNKLLFLPVWRYNTTKRLLKRLQSQINPKYDDIYLICHNIGESYVQLIHMAERIENNRSRRPLLICWDSKYLGFYEMFRPKNMDIQYIKADQEEIVLAFGGLNCRKKEVIIERDGQRFLCSSPAKNMRRLLEAGQTDINFYSYISECVGVKNTENPVLPVVSTEVVHRVEEKVEQMGLGKKFVIFAPETNSLVEIRPEFWNALARKLCANGYDIFQNIYLEYDDALKIEGAKSADMTIEEMFVLAQKSSGIISLGSGLAVFLTAAGVQMDLIYTKLNNYSPALIIHIYSVLHLPGVSPELVKEYDTDKLEESELLDEILKRY